MNNSAAAARLGLGRLPGEGEEKERKERKGKEKKGEE